MRTSISITFTALSFALIFGITGAVSVTPDAEARRKFEKATAEPSEENFKQGMNLVRERNYEAAIDSFQQAIYFSRNHYNPNALKMLGLCYKATRQYPKAIQMFLDHLKQTTEPAADARIDLAECYIEVKEFDKARDQITQSFREAPSVKGTHRQRYAQGELSERMGDTSQALSFYCNALDDKPLYTECWMAKARCEVKLKDYNEALKDYRGMLEKSPFLPGLDYHELYYNMGTCFYKRGDHQGALDRWRLALESNPESYDAHLALASMLDEERHISSAIKEYQAALRVAPKETVGRQKIEKRLLWLEQQIAAKDAPAVIKPSPSMRRDFEETIRQRNGEAPRDNTPVPKESGF